MKNIGRANLISAGTTAILIAGCATHGPSDYPRRALNSPRPVGAPAPPQPTALPEIGSRYVWHQTANIEGGAGKKTPPEDVNVYLKNASSKRDETGAKPASPSEDTQEHANQSSTGKPMIRAVHP